MGKKGCSLPKARKGSTIGGRKRTGTGGKKVRVKTGRMTSM